MVDEPKGTFTFNKDGSVDLPVEGKPIRFVKETDLLAVKGGAETKEREWVAKEQTYTTQLTEATRLRDETHQNFLRAQAEKEQLVTQYKDYDTFKTKVGELEKSVKEHQTSLQKHQEELAITYKTELISKGVKEESLKDKTLDQLRNLREAAKLFSGTIPKGANFDRGTGGGGSVPESQTERAHRIIAAQEEKQGIKARVSTEKASI